MPFYQGGPIFPPVPPTHAKTHRGWISAAADSSLDSSAEWAMAKFALDDLAHRAAILARVANKDRKDHPDATMLAPGIMEEFSDLLNDLQEWRNQPLVREAERNEKLTQLGRLPPATIPIPFLDHPPLPIYSQQFAHMMNHWRAIQIYMSLILWPDVWSQSSVIRSISNRGGYLSQFCLINERNQWRNLVSDSRWHSLRRRCVLSQ